MSRTRFNEAIEREFPAIIQTAAELIRIPSRNPPGEERQCAEYIHSRLKEFGFETHLVREPFTDRPQVVAIVRGKNDDTILLNGHMDTVPEGNHENWSVDPFSGIVKNGLLYGRGSVDMKSSLAVMMHVARVVETKSNLLLTFAVGEEIAEPGTSTLLSWIKQLDLKIKYGLVMEPTGLQIATHQNGAVWFSVKCKGKATHASMPSEGTNAIEAAYKIMSVLHEYQRNIETRSHELAGSPTCSITMIRGGIKENVIPDECEIVVDRRLIPRESSILVEKELVDLLRGSKIGCEAATIGSREPVALSKDSQLVRAMIETMREMNIRSDLVCFTGATDNEHIVAEGIDSLVWGPGDLKLAHAADERIRIEDIKNAAVSLGVIIDKLSS
jgi:succinyl-diaminopimelate desuccinylase